MERDICILNDYNWLEKENTCCDNSIIFYQINLNKIINKCSTFFFSTHAELRLQNVTQFRGKKACRWRTGGKTSAVVTSIPRQLDVRENIFIKLKGNFYSCAFSTRKSVKKVWAFHRAKKQRRKKLLSVKHWTVNTVAGGFSQTANSCKQRSSSKCERLTKCTWLSFSHPPAYSFINITCQYRGYQRSPNNQ